MIRATEGKENRERNIACLTLLFSLHGNIWPVKRRKWKEERIEEKILHSSVYGFLPPGSCSASTKKKEGKEKWQ